MNTLARTIALALKVLNPSGRPIGAGRPREERPKLAEQAKPQ
jgi:hypothetical protein